MVRIVSSPTLDPVAEGIVVTVDKGGTGATTIQEAAVKLNLLTQDLVGVAGGAITLTEDGLIDPAKLPVGTSTQNINVQGPLNLDVSAIGTYTITDYDQFTEYTLAAVSGTVSRVGDTITYTAPSTSVAGGFSVNGVSFDVIINAPYVLTPSIVTPINEAVGLGSSVTFTGSAFGVGAGADTHQSSDWQLATDSAFTAIVASATADTINKTSWTASGLSVSTTYYARCRYRGTAYGASAWSAVNSFTTKVSFIPGTEQAILTASDKATNDQFGWSVAISADGNTVCIGTINHDTGGLSNAGQAYIFTRSGSTWSQQALLSASDKSAGDQFGYSVAISNDGNTVCIGAPYNDISGTVGDAGQTYIFVRSGTTWSQQAVLSASDKAASDRFGYNVAISADGNTICIGAILHDAGGSSNAGQAYIFIRTGTTWSQQAILVASDKVFNDQFGTTVAISGDGNTVCIGAPNHDVRGFNDAGQAYIFIRSGTTWSQQAILSASDAATYDYFGWSVSLSNDGNTVCIGNIDANPDGVTNAGQAHIFIRSGTTWSEQAIISASDKAASEQFGQSVAISDDGNTVCVGAYGKTVSGLGYVGQAYIFTRSSTIWNQQAILSASDKAGSDWFGYSVAISGDSGTICIGSPNNDVGGLGDAGQAYIFA